MPFVTRNKEGKILTISLYKQSNDQEHLDNQDIEVLGFLGKKPENQDSTKIALHESDKDIARITEDLIHLLIQKNLIVFTELPKAVQEKILTREKLRSRLSTSTPNFLDENDSL